MMRSDIPVFRGRRFACGRLVPAALCGCGLLAAGVLAFAQTSEPPVEEAAQRPVAAATVVPAKPPAAMRIREGTEIEGKEGSFRPTGDRLAFYAADGSVRLVVLENQCLERVAGVVGQQADPLSWSVSGVVTEYRGANYLLLRQAVLNTRFPADQREP